MTDNKNTGSNSFMAVVLGALVGFAAGAVSMVLMDDKKRTQVVKASQKVAKDIKDKFEENKELISDKLNKTAKSLKSAVKE